MKPNPYRRFLVNRLSQWSALADENELWHKFFWAIKDTMIVLIQNEIPDTDTKVEEINITKKIHEN